MEILSHVRTWIKLEDTKLKKPITEGQILHEVYKVVKPIETESRNVIARGGGCGDGEPLLNTYKVSIMQDEKVLEI